MVYVEESDLEGLRVEYLTNRHAEVHAGHRQDVSSWSSDEASGLILFGFGLRDRTVAEFAALISGAESALKNAPR